MVKKRPLGAATQRPEAAAATLENPYAQVGAEPIRLPIIDRNLFYGNSLRMEGQGRPRPQSNTFSTPAAKLGLWRTRWLMGFFSRLTWAPPCPRRKSSSSPSSAFDSIASGFRIGLRVEGAADDRLLEERFPRLRIARHGLPECDLATSDAKCAERARGGSRS